MRRASILWASILLLLAAAPSRAGEPGTSGVSFLKLGAGPRGIAMGEAHTAVADDAYALYWNPGGMVQIRHPELAFMYNSHIEGINQQYVAYVHPLAGGTVLGASLTRLAVSPFESYDNSGSRTGDVSSDDLALGASIARSFILPGPDAPMIGLGGTVKSIRERLASSKASTFALDLGLLTRGWEGWFGPWARNVRAGLVLRHAGPGLRFVEDNTRLPTTIAAGVAKESRVWGDPFILAAEYSVPNDNDPTFSLGGEYWLHRIVAARLGYRVSQEEGLALRFGVGLKLRLIQLDYSFVGYGELGNTHRAGVTMRFGAPPAATQKRVGDFLRSAKDYLRQDRTYEAILEINQALDEDPGNEEAFELLRQAKKKLQGGESNVR